MADPPHPQSDLVTAEKKGLPRSTKQNADVKSSTASEQMPEEGGQHEKDKDTEKEKEKVSFRGYLVSNVPNS